MFAHLQGHLFQPSELMCMLLNKPFLLPSQFQVLLQWCPLHHLNQGQPNKTFSGNCQTIVLISQHVLCDKCMYIHSKTRTEMTKRIWLSDWFPAAMYCDILAVKPTTATLKRHMLIGFIFWQFTNENWLCLHFCWQTSQKESRKVEIDILC